MFRSLLVLPFCVLALGACAAPLPTDPLSGPQKVQDGEACDPATYAGPGECVPSGKGGFVVVS
jgi:hypothetical protein